MDFIGENIVTDVDFDCGVFFYPEAPEKFKKSIGNAKSFPDPVENSNWIPGKNQHVQFVFDEEDTSDIFLESFNLWYLDPPALLSHKPTTERGPRTIHYPQAWTQQPKTPKCGNLFFTNDGQ